MELNKCGCGGEAWTRHDPRTRTWRGYCATCYIATEEKATEAEAITAWNRAMSGRVDVETAWEEGYPYIKAIAEWERVNGCLTSMFPEAAVSLVKEMEKVSMGGKSCRRALEALQALDGGKK